MINRIRLPITIRNAQFPEDREAFRKANGETKTLSVVVRKTYDGVTDYLPEKLHERFKIALAHDNVEIENERYLGGVAQEGAYEIEWPDFLGYPLGRGTFKLNVTPFNATNSNCSTCEEFNQIDAEDDFIGTIGEDETVDVPILYNDSICCSPFEISIVTFNTDYVASATVVGNLLRITTKTPLATQNNVVLATYRVQCEDGMFDTAQVIANVEGSEEACLSPISVVLDEAGDTTAEFTITPPVPPPANGYIWNLYLEGDLINPVQSGSTATTGISLTGLNDGTPYVLFVASDCDGTLSDFVQTPFETTSEEPAGCGEYFLTTNGAFQVANVTYTDCFGGTSNTTVGPGGRYICARESAPGNPDEILSNIAININYVGPCFPA